MPEIRPIVDNAIRELIQFYFACEKGTEISKEREVYKELEKGTKEILHRFLKAYIFEIFALL